MKEGNKMALTNEGLQAIASLIQPINNRFDKIKSEIFALKVRNVKPFITGQVRL